jgi:hypothetical protein
MTKYSCDIHTAEGWEGIALFSDKASIPAMICFADQQFDLGNSIDSPADNIRIVDMETGELIFDWEDEHYWPDDDLNCDNDMGFDPYMGCYTDDC